MRPLPVLSVNLPSVLLPTLLPALASAAELEESAPGSQGLVLTLVVVAGAFFGISLFFGYFLRRSNARRRHTPTDEAGVRSVLAADAPFVKSLADAAQLLSHQLTAQGLAPEAPADALPDLVLPVAVDDDPFVLRLSLADGRLVVRVCDRTAANRPAAESRHAPLPRRALRTLLTHVDRAARQSPALARIQWHPRERFDQGDLSSPAHDPLGD